MRKRRGELTGLVVTLAGLFWAANAAALIVDDFTSATTNGVPNPIFGCMPGLGPGTCFITDLNVAQTVIGSTTVTDSGLADVLGGSRQMTVVADSLVSQTPPDLVVAGVVPVAGFLEYDSTALADGRVFLLYDGGGLGLAASLTIPDEVRVVILDADAASVDCEPPVMACTLGYDVTVTIRDSAMNSASATQTVLIPGGPLTLPFPFSTFAGVGGVNLGDIFSIEVEIDPNIAGDMRIDRIEVFERTPPHNPVPLSSPLSLALLIASLLVCGWCGRGLAR